MDTTMITQQLKLYALSLMVLAATGCLPSIPPPPTIPMTTVEADFWDHRNLGECRSGHVHLLRADTRV